MSWIFQELGNRAPNDPIGSEFFALENLGEMTEPLVRESIQNSTDNKIDKGSSEPVAITFKIVTTNKNLSDSSFFENLESHIKSDECGLISTPQSTQGVRTLLIEDFNTHGVRGDVAFHSTKAPTEKNDFHFLFRSLGRTGKTGDSLGSWGVGKNMYARVSTVATYFGYSIRDDTVPMILSGNSILRCHNVDGTDYDGHAIFGYADVNRKGLAMPVTSSSACEEFVSEFGLTRSTNQKGLSIVIPFLKEGVTVTNIVSAVIKQFSFPILRGDLIVQVIEKEHIELNATTLSTVLNEIETEEMERQKLVKHLAFIQWIIEDGFNAPISIDLGNGTKSPQWRSDLISDHNIEDALTKMEELDRVGFKVHFDIRKNSMVLPGSFYVFYEKDDSVQDSLTYQFYRNNLMVPGVEARVRRGYRALVLTEDATASMLREAEGPAHYNWTAETKHFKETYFHAQANISFVKNSIDRIIGRLIKPILEKDDTLLGSWFPREQEKKKGPPKRTDGPEPIKSNPQLKLSAIRGGIKIDDNPAIDSLASSYMLEVAYDTESGNPFVRYNVADFDIAKDSLKLSTLNVTILSTTENTLVFSPDDRKFLITLRGFDVKRDVVCRLVERSTE
jgi:hypothetical protein